MLREDRDRQGASRDQASKPKGRDDAQNTKDVDEARGEKLLMAAVKECGEDPQAVAEQLEEHRLDATEVELVIQAAAKHFGNSFGKALAERLADMGKRSKLKPSKEK
jgi:hypothetical protein